SLSCRDPTFEVHLTWKESMQFSLVLSALLLIATTITAVDYEPSQSRFAPAAYSNWASRASDPSAWIGNDDVIDEAQKRAPMRLGKRAAFRMGKRAAFRMGKRAPMRLGKRGPLRLDDWE
ncbi:hypothetical protein PENTCL1PPCAC_29722, partial [Pristionchus entomophagus]